MAVKKQNGFDNLKTQFQDYLKQGQQRSQSSNSTIPTGTKDDENNGIDAKERRLIRILQFCILVAMGYFILGNIRPYIDVVDQLFFQWQETGVYRMFANIPLLGWFLSGGLDLTKLAIGCILWAALQLLELLPSIIMDSPIFILRTLNFIKNWRTIPAQSGDSEVARKLKTHYNAIPGQVIEQANIARAVAYVVDGAICIWFFNPIVGGWGNLSLVTTAGAWDYIDWQNVIYILTTLFAVEVLYWVYKLVTRIATVHFANN